MIHKGKNVKLLSYLILEFWLNDHINKTSFLDKNPCLSFYYLRLHTFKWKALKKDRIQSEFCSILFKVAVTCFIYSIKELDVIVTFLTPVMLILFESIELTMLTNLLIVCVKNLKAYLFCSMNIQILVIEINIKLNFYINFYNYKYKFWKFRTYYINFGLTPWEIINIK